MPRGDQRIVDQPFRTWVVTVEKNNRVRLPLDEISAVVRWIDVKTGPIECVGMPGPWGGIQLAPLTEHRQDVRPFIEATQGTPPDASESSESWVDVARLLATSWLIPISIEANRISFTLPEPPRRGHQVPGAGARVVVYGFGNILEIWDAAKWHDHVREIAKRKATAISEALEDLAQR